MDAPQLAEWLKNRLASAEGDWRRLVGAMYAHLMKQPFDAVVDEGQVRALVRAHVDAARLEALIRIAFEAGVRPAVAGGRADAEAVGRWMPEGAQTRLAALVGQPGLVRDVWVQELFKQEAAEELLAETLYQSLKDFSTLVPRILEKVLPSGLGRLAGFAANAGGKVFDEVERVLDGEIKRFLEKGTRRALDRAARFAAQNMDGPTAIEGRKNMVRFVLSKSGQFHVEPLTDERVAEIEAIATETARHIAGLEETQTVIDRTIAEVRAATQGKTVGEVLQTIGAPDDPPLDAWATATWPIVRHALEAPEVQAWIDTLAEGFFAEASA